MKLNLGVFYQHNYSSYGDVKIKSVDKYHHLDYFVGSALMYVQYDITLQAFTLRSEDMQDANY